MLRAVAYVAALAAATLLAPVAESADVDSDGDLVPDYLDNCYEVANPSQADGDGDGCGDACALKCDVNGDGITGISDFLALQACYNKPASCDPPADCTNDGIINMSDFLMFQLEFNTTSGPSGLFPWDLGPGCNGGGPGLLVNNGLAPPVSENVFDATDSMVPAVAVHDQGCPRPLSTCQSNPGPPTDVQIASDGSVPRLFVYETSTATVNGEVKDEIWVRDSAEVTLSGGSVADEVLVFDTGRAVIADSSAPVKVEAVDDAVVEVTGDGDAVDVTLRDTSTLDVTGTNLALDVQAFGTSHVDVDATFTDGVHLWESSTATATGGGHTDLVSRFQVCQNAQLDVSGGSWGKLFGFCLFGDDTRVWLSGSPSFDIVSLGGVGEFDMSGGTIATIERIWNSVHVRLSGGTIPSGVTHCVDDTALFEVFGTGFQIDGSPVGYGDVVGTSVTLSGTLESGDPIAADFAQGDPGGCSGTLRLSAPPAP